ncbi:replication initiation protein [Thiocapsa rosea]|uniref:Replication initiator protein n=1 Tax=Thiocapsa rosea TaxID=69360 RepID=A0A495UKY7_9GAMM|nr:replication initiation protein [Thiocapsa rosea]RKT37946.1 replication initiator protein [Thiocapsa rosea]
MMHQLAQQHRNEQLLKPTATIHVGNRLSLIERKVFNAIIWHSQNQRSAKPANYMSVDLLMSLIGLERSKNTEVIMDALERLTTTPIVWNTLKKDRTADWGVCTFLAGAEMNGGRLRYVLNPLLVEKVEHPTLFAKIQLLVQTRFSSKYSLALYEFLIDEMCRNGNPKTHVFQVSLDTLRHVLQFDGIYKHLNSDVLKPCVKEINKHSDISLVYSGVKKGRAVAALLLTIERKAVQLALTDLVTVETSDDPLNQLELMNDPLEQMLVTRGVGKRKAKALVETYDETRIRENIAHVEREYQAGKVKVLSAYLIRAIEEDYRPKVKSAALPERSEMSEREAAEKAREELLTDWNRYRERRVRERFAVLSSAEQEAHRSAFVERLDHTSSILKKQFKKDGFASRMVDAQFFSELHERLLESPEELDLDAYRASLMDIAEVVAARAQG